MRDVRSGCAVVGSCEATRLFIPRPGGFCPAHYREARSVGRFQWRHRLRVAGGGIVVIVARFRRRPDRIRHDVEARWPDCRNSSADANRRVCLPNSARDSPSRGGRPRRRQQSKLPDRNTRRVSIFRKGNSRSDTQRSCPCISNPDMRGIMTSEKRIIALGYAPPTIFITAFPSANLKAKALENGVLAVPDKQVGRPAIPIF